ncbi:putative transcriptional regulator YheO [Rhodococcus sp. 27YEA15]|uniref:helix-turn-helix transcriptional regulator n=1 Tax=Rhodococcus sp. 27YEA15 TaxID=3156259 RepID=UPI003C7E139A
MMSAETASEPNHAPGSSPVTVFSKEDREDARRVVETVGPIVEALALAWEPRSEVVLHNLTKLPTTIEAISGNLTGRQIGGPPTDLGIRNFSSGWRDHLIGYRTETENGVQMRSSSIFFHGSSGRAVACLCINTDIDKILAVQEVLRSMSSITTIDPALRAEPLTDSVISPTVHESPRKKNETFPATVDALAAGILIEAIRDVGVPVDLMKKSHKVEVVRSLRRSGFFTIRESVELAAQELRVGRHTVYNYINEIESQN